MNLAYLTHDEVNAATARYLAPTVAVLNVSHEVPTNSRLICDLDHLPAEVKADLLATARAGGELGGVAVHSYNLRRGEADLLRAAGVIVSRRLSPKLFAPPLATRRVPAVPVRAAEVLTAA